MYQIVLVTFILFSHTYSFSDMGFWCQQQRKGTNFFNQVEKIDRFQAAKKIGVDFIRLAPNKWQNGRFEEERGDFLIGRSPLNTTPIQADVTYLKKILDQAQESGLKVVLTMLSLPGNRWGQHNQGVKQRDVWKSFEAQEIVLQFWVNLANDLKGHPALIGYNIKNEPSPELVDPVLPDWVSVTSYTSWYQKVKGTPADLNLFYQKIVSRIRGVDKKTPIILDVGYYATPAAFEVFEPVNDPHVLYSFHMYEPYVFTTYKNKSKYFYPGLVPTGEKGSQKLLWNKAQVLKFLLPVYEWQVRHQIPSDQILVGEFGVYRYNKGAAQYLKDLIETFNSYGWHWAFYAFREDSWHGMDYELGVEAPKENYWKAISQKKLPDYSLYETNSLFKVIQEGLK